MKKETYADQLHRKAYENEHAEAERAAERSAGLKVVAFVFGVGLALCGFGIFFVLGGCVSGGWPWVALLWPFAAAAAVTVLSLLAAAFLGLANGMKANRDDGNGWLN
jgi:fatty acid desaturase